MPTTEQYRLDAVIASNTITRPADTTQYASGDLIADTTTAASVTPFSFAGAVKTPGRSIRIERIKVRTSNTSLTNASFRIWLFYTSPTVTNGDNGALTGNLTSAVIGSLDVTLNRAWADGASGTATPTFGNAMLVELNAGSTMYALMEAQAAYTPTSAQTFSLELEGYRF